MRRCALLTVAAICLGGCEVSFSADNVSVGQVKGNVSTSAPATTRTFVNSRDTARSAPLQQYYVDFSFDYPNHWTITPQPNDGSAQNFVRVAAPLLDGYEPFAVHVGYAYGTGDAAADRRDLEGSLPQFAEQFGRNFQNYRVVSVGTDQVAGQETLNWRFTATAPGVNGTACASMLLPSNACATAVAAARSAGDTGMSTFQSTTVVPSASELLICTLVGRTSGASAARRSMSSFISPRIHSPVAPSGPSLIDSIERRTGTNGEAGGVTGVGVGAVIMRGPWELGGGDVVTVK